MRTPVPYRVIAVAAGLAAALGRASAGEQAETMAGTLAAAWARRFEALVSAIGAGAPGGRPTT